MLLKVALGLRRARKPENNVENAILSCGVKEIDILQHKWNCATSEDCVRCLADDLFEGFNAAQRQVLETCVEAATDRVRQPLDEPDVDQVVHNVRVQVDEVRQALDGVELDVVAEVAHEILVQVLAKAVHEGLRLEAGHLLLLGVCKFLLKLSDALKCDEFLIALQHLQYLGPVRLATGKEVHLNLKL